MQLHSYMFHCRHPYTSAALLAKHETHVHLKTHGAIPGRELMKNLWHKLIENHDIAQWIIGRNQIVKVNKIVNVQVRLLLVWLTHL